MTLKDLLRKKSHIEGTSASQGHRHAPEPETQPEAEREKPEFTFIRTTTTTEEIISPPSFPGDERPTRSLAPKDVHQLTPEKKRPHIFRKLTGNTQAHKADTVVAVPVEEKPEKIQEPVSAAADTKSELPVRPKNERKLSDRFRLNNRHRTTSRESVKSVNLPEGLGEAPETIPAPSVQPDLKKNTPSTSAASSTSKSAKEEREALWEKRATRLALNTTSISESKSTPDLRPQSSKSNKPSPRSPQDEQADEESLQQAIRLHESGDLQASTRLFGQLSDPTGANSALSQVLYGLALRHGWGIPTDPERALHYLTLAATNSASVEAAALNSGLRSGGRAKGELVLAIFELANCWRYGWGVATKDPVAARTYYETAANLGDADALEEAAWCCLEGYGGAKDKFRAAQYLRLAEMQGRKSVGNSWIWKEKYNPKT